MAKLKHCRICLGDDGDDTAFTAPCLCKGTIKWVHVDCLTDWRQSQMQAGQAEDMNRCTMCKAKFRVRRKQKWASLLNYKGYLMKICIQLSVAMANYSTTFNTTALLAMIQAYITNFATRLSMVSGTDIPIQFLSLLSTNLFSIAPTDLASTASPTMSYVAYAMYAPFPVCSSHYSSYPLPSTTRVLQKLRSPFDKNLPAKEVVQPFIHYILAPFTDNRLWYFLLCYCQHLHLGFFFLGSVYNVFTTYSVLNEMYDLVLEELGDHEGDPDHPHQPVALQRYKNAIKKFLLVYSSMLGMIVWIHYNLVAFRGWQQRDLRKLPEHVPNQAFSSHLLQVITLSSSQLDRMDSHDPKSAPISMDDFLLELPLWTLRWMTLAFAVFDFSVRRVYRWVARHVYRIDAEEVINLEDSTTMESNDIHMTRSRGHSLAESDRASALISLDNDMSADEGYDEQRTDHPAFAYKWSDEQRAEYAFQMLMTLPTAKLANIHARITPLLHRDFISLLPYELALHIFKFTDPVTLGRAAKVSRRWRKVTADQALWRQFYYREGWTVNVAAMERYLSSDSSARDVTDSFSDLDNNIEELELDRPMTASEVVELGASSAGLDMAIAFDNESGLEDVDMEPHENSTDEEGATGRLRQHGGMHVAEPVSAHTSQASLDLHSTTSTAVSSCTSMIPQRRRPSEETSTSHSNPISRLKSLRRPAELISRLRLRQSTTTSMPNLAAAARRSPSSSSSLVTLGQSHSEKTRLSRRGQDAASLSNFQPMMSPNPTPRPVTPPRLPIPLPERSIVYPHPQHQDARGNRMINWKFLYRNRSLVEKHWREGTFRSFEMPLTEYPRDGHEEGIYCIQFDDNKLVSGSRDTFIKIWDMRTRRCIATLAHHTASVLCLQYDDEYILSGSSDKTILQWDIHTGIVLRVFRGHQESVLNLKFDKRTLVSCSKDRTVKVWDMNTGALLRTLHGHRAAVNAVQFQDDVIVSASGDRTIKLWNLHTGACLRTFDSHSRGIACVHFDGRWIVSGSSDHTIKIWDVFTGTCVNTLRGHTDLVRTLQFDCRKDPDGKRSGKIVSGSYDETIKIWDWRTGKVLVNLKDGHSNRVFKVQFNDTKIVSCSQDQKIIVWDFGVGTDATFLLY